VVPGPQLLNSPAEKFPRAEKAPGGRDNTFWPGVFKKSPVQNPLSIEAVKVLKGVSPDKKPGGEV